MRSAHHQPPADRDLRHRIGRIDGLPLRPSTARSLLAEHPDDADDPRPDPAEAPRRRALTDLDPAWAESVAREGRAPDPLELVADRPWWPACSLDGRDALTTLWRHSVAVALAARRLAREANDPDPDRVARAGLLYGLGLWAVAAADPDWLARWLAADDADARRAQEQRDLGADLPALGRTLAERWGLDPLVAEAAWLHDLPDRGLLATAAEPARVALIQAAVRLAERTPWSLSAGRDRSGPSHDPRVKLLTAKVQSRCASPFVESDVGPREEALSRSNARLRLRVDALTAGQASRDRLLSVLADGRPGDAPEAWAERAGLAWCAEPGVSAARVAWSGSEPDHGTAPPERQPTVVVPLTDRGRTVATVHLWAEPGWSPEARVDGATLAAWSRWAAWVDDRERLRARLDQVVGVYRQATGSEGARLRAAKLDALAEFAAGAGHELNNPLAVVVGRAQLLLGRETDPAAARSLRAILTQAQRAHRILRDLMYVARPPEPRPRFCQPDEIVRASVRDARDDAEAREVRVVAEAPEPGRRVWADPDGLRHLADSLLRNAVEASARGGQVRFAARGDAATLRWTVEDHGRGVSSAEGEHLFDPFFCGRQAGRGLGMGLPRAARYVGQVGGEIRYHSAPGQGATFVVRLPLAEPPKPPGSEPDGPATA